MKKIIISIALIILLVLFVSFVFDWGRMEVKAPILDTNASSTTEALIMVNNIKDNQEISSPFKVKGKARGYWFFEASFPVQLIDVNGNVLVSTYASAESEWMTTDFVNFTTTLEFTKPTSTNKALLILNKDNPSGDPKFDQAIYIPVILK